MTLRQIGERYGISRRTIQGYEAHGLVAASGKTKYGYLLYDQSALEVILKIRQYQDFGFTVCQICELFKMTDSEKREKLKMQEVILEKRKKCTEAALEKLKKMIDTLQA